MPSGTEGDWAMQNSSGVGGGGCGKGWEQVSRGWGRIVLPLRHPSFSSQTQDNPPTPQDNPWSGSLDTWVLPPFPTAGTSSRGGFCTIRALTALPGPWLGRRVVAQRGL